MAKTHGTHSTYTAGCRCEPCRQAATLASKAGRQRRAALLASGAVVEHGRVSTYQHWGCRCADCRAAWRDAFADLRRRMAERLAQDPTAATHGRKSTYSNWGCRCEPCAEAHAAALRAYRRGGGSRG